MKGLVVCSFGTSHKDTYDKCILPILNHVKEEYSYEMPVLEAFTSRKIIKILDERDGVDKFTEEEALSQLNFMGRDELYVLSLHLLGGFEYEKILQAISNFHDVKVTRPLLESLKDLGDFARKIKFDDGRYYVLMGHGSDHEADNIYELLEEEYRKNGNDHVFIGTVEGKRSINDCLEELKKKNIKDVVLRPLMLVAGDHAKNDMAGDEDDSWKSILMKNGINVHVELIGLGEYEEIRQIFYDRLKEILC